MSGTPLEVLCCVLYVYCTTTLKIPRIFKSQDFRSPLVVGQQLVLGSVLNAAQKFLLFKLTLKVFGISVLFNTYCISYSSIFLDIFVILVIYS